MIECVDIVLVYQLILVYGYIFIFFFFQAEDGIRDDLVTGVQTCALPISLIEIPEGGISFQDVVTDMERELIVQSLRKTNGNKKLAAKLLNLKRTTLIEKIKRIGLAEHMAAHA